MNLCLRKLFSLLLFAAISAEGAAADVERIFRVYNAADGLSDNSAQTITCTFTGRLVISTMGNINFFDGQRFSYIDAGNENLYTLQNYRGNYHLYFDREHHMWLKNSHTVTCIDLHVEKFVTSVEEEFRKMGIEGSVLDIFVDNTGCLWALTPEGLYGKTYKRTYPVPTDRNLQDVECYKDLLLLFYEDGVVEGYDRKTGTKSFACPAYPDTDVARYNRSSVLLVRDNIVYQIRNGEQESELSRFDVVNEQWTPMMRLPYHMNNIEEKDSMLYIPSSYGYWVYDLATNQTIHQEQLTLLGGQKLSTDINALAFDLQGGMWLGTEKRGLLYAKPYPSPFRLYAWTDPKAMDYSRMLDHEAGTNQDRFRGKDVNTVYKDSRGWTWVGTSSGLQLYKQSSDNLPQVITRNNGLTNNVIHTIIEDDSHNLWLGTSYGISCLIIDGGKVKSVSSFTRSDNVPSESFVNGRVMKQADGTIVMQALDHIIAFNPADFHTIVGKMPFDIYPKLIKLLVNGNEVHTGEALEGNVILNYALARTKEINLNYNQNTISLTFSALNYFRPQQTFYRVRIKGYDDRWRVYSIYDSNGLVDKNGLFHLPLVGMEPGTYTIEVQASMYPDDWEINWDKAPYEWVININQPWWRTTGIFLAFGFLMLVVIVLNIVLYMRNTRMRMRRNAEEGGVIKRIVNVIDTCTDMRSGQLTPRADEIYGRPSEDDSAVTPEFINTMFSILPVVKNKKAQELTMRQLSQAAGMDVPAFYNLVTSNVYKNPQKLASAISLKHAAELLTTTKKNIADISAECGFITPNYFIAAFMHEFGDLPDIYRMKS